MSAIFFREFKSYFHSFTGYIFTAFLTFFLGLYFTLINVINGFPYYNIILPNVIFIFMFAFPVLTMRSMAEERKTKTDQLLLTAPISVTQMVLGKYFSMLAVYAVPVVLSALCPLLMLTRTYHHLGPDLLGLLLFFLLGGVYIAIGMFISSTTESQVIAAVLSIAAFVVLYLCSSFVSFYPTTAFASLIGVVVILLLICTIYYFMSKNLYVTGIIGLVGGAAIALSYFLNSSMYENLIPTALKELTITQPLDAMASNTVFDLTGVVYYVSIIALFCFLTIQSVQKRRWS